MICRIQERVGKRSVRIQRERERQIVTSILEGRSRVYDLPGSAVRTETLAISSLCLYVSLPLSLSLSLSLSFLSSFLPSFLPPSDLAVCLFVYLYACFCRGRDAKTMTKKEELKTKYIITKSTPRTQYSTRTTMIVVLVNALVLFSCYRQWLGFTLHRTI